MDCYDSDTGTNSRTVPRCHSHESFRLSAERPAHLFQIGRNRRRLTGGSRLAKILHRRTGDERHDPLIAGDQAGIKRLHQPGEG